MSRDYGTTRSTCHTTTPTSLHSRDSGTKYRMVWYTYDVDVDVDVDVLSLEYLLRS
jgi:hypothetical protein